MQKRQDFRGKPGNIRIIRLPKKLREVTIKCDVCLDYDIVKVSNKDASISNIASALGYKILNDGRIACEYCAHREEAPEYNTY